MLGNRQAESPVMRIGDVARASGAGSILATAGVSQPDRAENPRSMWKRVNTPLPRILRLNRKTPQTPIRNRGSPRNLARTAPQNSPKRHSIGFNHFGYEALFRGVESMTQSSYQHT
jgi:hypothetical protein